MRSLPSLHARRLTTRAAAAFGLAATGTSFLLLSRHLRGRHPSRRNHENCAFRNAIAPSRVAPIAELTSMSEDPATYLAQELNLGLAPALLVLRPNRPCDCASLDSLVTSPRRLICVLCRRYMLAKRRRLAERHSMIMERRSMIME